MAVSLSPVGGAAAQFFTDNGIPLSGGRIYTYAAGTSTPATTYTSISGSTPHSNPIILDATGRVSTGEVWLTTGNAYKFVITDSSNVLIGTYDNVSGINDISLYEFTPNSNSLLYPGPLTVKEAFDLVTNDETGADYVGFIADGAGAVARTVTSKLRESVSVLDYGAVGDGVANDAAAFTAAGLAASYIEVPSGTYNIATDITITKPLVFTGGVISVASGHTLTLNGTSAPASAQIFDPAAGGAVEFEKAPPEIYPEWWGATGDGTTDDAASFNACFDSLVNSGGGVRLSACTYKVGSPVNVSAKTIVSGAGCGIAEEGATVIYGTHNGKILNCEQDGFVIQDVCVKGPDNAAYTNSVGIYTVTTKTPTGAMNFTLQSVYVLNCYDNININASYNGILFNVISQHAYNYGIKALCAQGQWNQVSCLFNKSHGLYVNNYAGDDFNSSNASPTIVNFQTYDNGGSGIYVAGSYTGYNSATEVTTQGLTLEQFFINNDATGGIFLADKASANQVFTGTLTNGQIQYCGKSSWATRNNNAAGLYIGTNVGKTGVTNVFFYDSAANHVEHKGQGLTLNGCNFTGAAKGVPANALGAGNVYVAPPTPYGDHNNCVFSQGSNLIMSDCSSDDPLNLQGDYNRVCNSWFSTDYAATNGSGTSTQQTPTLNIANGSIENYLTGVGMYQANTSSSASARSFGGQTGSEYSLINCQVYNNNGASDTNSGTVITPYTP